MSNKELKERISELEAEVKLLEEIETDLNGTMSYLEMGVATWKERAEELEAEMKQARKCNNCMKDQLSELEWVSARIRLPDCRAKVFVTGQGITVSDIDSPNVAWVCEDKNGIVLQIKQDAIR